MLQLGMLNSENVSENALATHNHLCCLWCHSTL